MLFISQQIYVDWVMFPGHNNAAQLAVYQEEVVHVRAIWLEEVDKERVTAAAALDVAVELDGSTADSHLTGQLDRVGADFKGCGSHSFLTFLYFWV